MGRQDQDFRIEHFPEIKTIEDINNFASEFGYQMPDGFLKTPKKQKPPSIFDKPMPDIYDF